MLDGVDVVYHQAAQPGVRLSWSDGFGTYDECNVLATQRLLEAVRSTASVRRVVYASSSSVYGNAARYPVVETDLPRPHSPYGVTKLAGEHLCNLYAHNYGISTVALRYFTVYGPRQRPDMAHHRLIEAALDGTTFPLYGDGSHVRDFTYVGDVVRANLLAGRADIAAGTVVNICAGGSTIMRDLIDAVGEAVGTAGDDRPARPSSPATSAGPVGATTSPPPSWAGRPSRAWPTASAPRWSGTAGTGSAPARNATTQVSEPGRRSVSASGSPA